MLATTTNADTPHQAAAVTNSALTTSKFRAVIGHLEFAESDAAGGALGVG